ncbi:hypothetical protein [Novosphingobium sp.]|uniref:hypothetical protein n=1 Tax=Novosphingobium sp. TaxID=1874826 RepID=UPI00286A854F|nr:hypothetical protein [Novosphingobium sp.]
MDFWTVIMVLGIVAITSLARVLRAKYNAQHGIVTDRRGNMQMLAQPSDSELQREVETLRERIKVLERIATDGRQSNNLAAEIESLRGQ